MAERAAGVSGRAPGAAKGSAREASGEPCPLAWRRRRARLGGGVTSLSPVHPASITSALRSLVVCVRGQSAERRPNGAVLAVRDGDGPLGAVAQVVDLLFTVSR
jgi:hypothetical protein